MYTLVAGAKRLGLSPWRVDRSVEAVGRTTTVSLVLGYHCSIYRRKLEEKTNVYQFLSQLALRGARMYRFPSSINNNNTS